MCIFLMYNYYRVIFLMWPFCGYRCENVSPGQFHSGFSQSLGESMYPYVTFLSGLELLPEPHVGWINWDSELMPGIWRGGFLYHQFSFVGVVSSYSLPFRLTEGFEAPSSEKRTQPSSDVVQAVLPFVCWSTPAPTQGSDLFLDPVGFPAPTSALALISLCIYGSQDISTSFS